MKTNSVQAENSVFFQQLDICCQKIAQKIGQENIAEWKNSDYISLNRLLHRETKVNLSENTLKRIFGKLKTSTRYYPQKATRDALAQFIGFRDWYEFELLHQVSVEKPVPEQVGTAQPSPAKPKDKKKKQTFYLSMLVLFVLGLVGLIYLYTQHSQVTNVQLICLNPNGQSPHSAIFKLGVKGALKEDPSLFTIDFADARLRRAKFSDSLINHYYETPGRYFPVLYYRGTALDTTSVYLQSEGWSSIATLQHDTTRVYPIQRNESENASYHHVTSTEVLHAGVDTSKTFFVSFANVKPTNISADHLEFSSFIKTSANRPGVRCSQTDIIIYGEKDWHSFGIIKPQCAAWAAFKFSELSQDGGKTDLRALGHDLSKGGNLRVRIENQNVHIFINNREIFKTRYTRPIGKFMGIKIVFAGIGSFRDFKLHDLKTGEIF
ncbi:hypothetical protein SAMN05421820_102330 [Pedobacter steynii]|uniref:Uncharacterized protein n=1 Tax=Pedobacter steynii TaxID=430522 RepID=A0A1G9NHT6_9SPHI|nr:hypothetical protein [Pedobacter steynii]NQX39299.1 hypothetical protein [Pedobacter steynii]SDL85941.1 hypothetical protein SAMN05421820_102330 [Pedobacter steynii]